jgi:hypothetical protein
MAGNSTDSVILGAALAVAAMSWGWCGWRVAKTSRAAPEPRVKLSASGYTPAGRDAPASRTEVWPAPKAQEGGWVYDVFTPPEIYYDARTKAFSVTPPELTPPKAEAAPFGLEVLEVRRPLFRLQLVGFVGEEGNYLGLFQNVATTETFLAEAGRRLPELELTIERFEVGLADVALPESMTTRRRVATATVRDGRTGETVVLTDAAPHYTNTAVAIVAASGDRTVTREVREGEEVEFAGAHYKIEKIQLAPVSVVVSKVSSDPLNPARRTLTPPDPTARDQPAP